MHDLFDGFVQFLQFISTLLGNWNNNLMWVEFFMPDRVSRLSLRGMRARIERAVYHSSLQVIKLPFLFLSFP